MSKVPWEAFAKSPLRGKPGETFGCEVDDVYFDVGDNCAWVDLEGGDIILTAFASTSDGRRAERTATIPRTSK